MSLGQLLPEHVAAGMMAHWPTEPQVYERDSDELDTVIAPELLHEYIDTGCVPAAEIAVMKQAPAIHPGAFTTNGRTDPVKLRGLYDAGYTIRLGNLQRVIPFLAQLVASIHEQTGYSNYVHAFLTPPGNQGLLHHWDQQLAVITQLSGSKQWELWKPPADIQDPMREYQESFRVWRESYMTEWQAAGPDLVIDLGPGQSLILPRGWVHNPHNKEGDEPSIHLTFAIRERTPFWIAEKLIAGAIERQEFRQVLPPDSVTCDRLPGEIRRVKRRLIAYLEAVDAQALTETLSRAARSELEYIT